jgi:hypothetical protein
MALMTVYPARLRVNSFLCNFCPAVNTRSASLFIRVKPSELVAYITRRRRVSGQNCSQNASKGRPAPPRNKTGNSPTRSQATHEQRCAPTSGSLKKQNKIKLLAISWITVGSRRFIVPRKALIAAQIGEVFHENRIPASIVQGSDL